MILLTGLRQKTIRKQPQTQVAQGIYTKHEKIAETQVYQENYQIEVKPLLYIGLRLFLTKKCLSPANRLSFSILVGSLIMGAAIISTGAATTQPYGQAIDSQRA
jgi:hypothetical protein